MLNVHEPVKVYWKMEEVAAMLNCTDTTIRNYEAIYSLRLQRSGGHHRKFTQKDIDKLRAIQSLLRYFHTAGIKAMLKDWNLVESHGLNALFIPKLMRLKK